MITSLYLEGFKSFGKPVTIDFRDITLLYGENSSGKSSILQALQYAREVFCNGNLDCLKTEIGGDFVDLRGFDRFVNKRQKEKLIVIGISTEVEVEKNYDGYEAMLFTNANSVMELLTSHFDQHESVREELISLNKGLNFSKIPTNDCVLPVESAGARTHSIAAAIAIGHKSRADSRLILKRIEVSYDGIPIVVLDHNETLEPAACEFNNDYLNSQVVYTVAINVGHALLPRSILDACRRVSILDKSDYLALLESLPRAVDGGESDSDTINSGNVEPIMISFFRRSLARTIAKYSVSQDPSQSHEGWIDRLLSLRGSGWVSYNTTYTFDVSIPSVLRNPAHIAHKFGWDFNRDPEQMGPDFDEDSQVPGFENFFDRPLLAKDLWDLNLLSLYASSALVNAFSRTSELLNRCKYIGPLRRHYTAPSQQTSKSDCRCWADGLGAWDYLGADPKLIELVNGWLTDQALFGFDCEIDTTQGLRSKLDELLANVDGFHAEQIRQIVSNISDTDQVIIKSPDGYRLNSTDVGVGFSQVLPIIVAARGPQPACVLLEQPELHIHVRLQAVLGDLLATGIEAGSAPEKRRQFIVETHSEALLLRLMRRIRETTKEIVNNAPRLLCDHVAVYHISKQDGNSIAKKIELDTYGNLTDEWPDDLFEIGYKERFGE